MRQVITPDRLRGSANAAYRLLVSGAIALGALLGGVLGGWIGLPLTLLVGAVGTSCSWLWLLCSPLARLRQLPVPVDEAPPSLARGAVDSEVNLPSSSAGSSAEKQDNVLPAVIVGSGRRSDPPDSDR